MKMSFNRSRLAEWILGAMVLIIALRCVDAAAYRAAAAPSGLFAVDFGAFYGAAHRLNAGEPLYAYKPGDPLGPHVSSPLLPVLVRPLARMPEAAAARAWALVNVTLLTLAIFLYCWGAGINPLEQAAPVVLLVLTAFRFWPTTIELGIGNCDIVLLFLAAGMFVCNRYGKWMLFALLVAVAALTKTWMVGAVFYLLVRRKWGAALATFGFLAAGAAILFTLVGWSQLPAMLNITKAYSAQADLVSNSVLGMARLYFTKNLIISPLTVSPVLHLAVIVIGYGFLAAGLGCLWLRAPGMDEEQLRICLGMTLVALVLGCPVSHQYYFVLILPLLWSLLFRVPRGRRGWVVPVAAFLIYLVYTVPTPSLNPVPPQYHHGIRSLEVGTSFFFGMLLWTCGLFAVLRGLRVPSREASDERSTLAGTAVGVPLPNAGTVN
jgi:hypothetical protein